MSSASQKRALQNYRKRLNARGMVRFEVLGLLADRELIRSLARPARRKRSGRESDSRDGAQDHRERAAQEGRDPCRLAPFPADAGRSRRDSLDDARPHRESRDHQQRADIAEARPCLRHRSG
jgi:hypothetical protein